jgi:hypothetical protein
MLKGSTKISKRLLKKASIVAVIALFSLFSAVTSHALVIFFSDIDNTLFYWGNSQLGTRYVLTRLNYPIVPLQPVPSGPAKIYVSIDVFDKYKDKFAKSEKSPGRIHLEGVPLPTGTTPEGKVETFTPGEYYLAPADSFTFFNSNQGSENYFLAEIERAIKESPSREWIGFTLPLVRAFLSNKDLAPGFGAVTSRGHSREEHMAGFGRLSKLPKNDPGYLPEGIRPEMIFPVSHPDLAYLSGSGSDITAQKVAVFKLALQQLSNTELTEFDLRIHPDDPAREKIKTHLFVYADDSAAVLSEAIKAAEDSARARVGSRVKTVLLNLATEADIKTYRLPSERFITIRTDGTTRAATVEEIFSENPELSKAQMEKIFKAALKSKGLSRSVEPVESKGMACGNSLKGGGR